MTVEAKLDALIDALGFDVEEIPVYFESRLTGERQYIEPEYKLTKREPKPTAGESALARIQLGAALSLSRAMEQMTKTSTSVYFGDTIPEDEGMQQQGVPTRYQSKQAYNFGLRNGANNTQLKDAMDPTDENI